MNAVPSPVELTVTLARGRYLTDARFHAAVDTAVAATMHHLRPGGDQADDHETVRLAATIAAAVALYQQETNAT